MINQGSKQSKFYLENLANSETNMIINGMKQTPKFHVTEERLHLVIIENLQAYLIPWIGH